MKKNLLTAILVFFFTYVVLLVMNDVSHPENIQFHQQNYTVDR